MLGGAVALCSAAGARRASAGPEPVREDAKPIPKRPFGKTGFESTVFGLGCYYVGAARSDADGVAIVRRALDLGCNYLDTAPSYVGGASERRVGIALEGLRDRIFLSTKTLERDGPAARRDLEASLKRLRTDRVDMVQVHCVTDAKDLEKVLSEAGPLPALLEAKRKGLLRFVGVTGHRHPEVVRAAVERYAWDAVLMPLNAADAHWKSFVTGALPAAVERGMARVAMKVLGAGRLVSGPGALSARDCLRYAYGLDVSTAVVGCASVEEVEVAARAATEATPLTAAERDDLVRRAAPMSGGKDPRAEWWKQT